MKTGIIILIVIIVLILTIIYNTMIVKRRKIERNKSLVDVFLKKRFDLIPNLVEVCKGYSKFEKDTLEDIVKLRQSFNENQSDDNKKKLTDEYKKVIALVESYPDLKANSNYLKLQDEMVNVENELQASRRIYINSITSYNNYIMSFPISLFALIGGFKKVEYPEFNYEEIKVKF